MFRKAALVVLFVVLLAAASLAHINMLLQLAVVFGGPGQGDKTKPAVERVAAKSQDLDASARSSDGHIAVASPSTPSPPDAPMQKADDPGIKTGLSVARISKDGPSVFAGTAAPFSRVTVLDGDKEVATATANDSGDWSAVTDYKFSGTNPDIKLKALEQQAAADSTGGKPETVTAPPAASPPVIAPSSSGTAVAKPSTASPAAQLMTSFENVVAEAREEAKKDSSPATVAAKPAPPPTITPVPMTFVFDEDVLTPDGDHSTALLLEYLKLKHFASVTLTGHADERGTAEYNMELSRRRLDAILVRLRNGGYQGKVNLVPKGSSDPFVGIDRTRFDKEDLMQLDRRVELRAAQ